MLRTLRSLPTKVGGFVVFATATAAQIGTADPPLQPPTDLSWLTTRPNPWSLITAVLAALSAVASLYQLLGPKPATAVEVRTDGRRTRRGLEQVSSQLAAEGKASEQRDAAILAAVRASGLALVLRDIEEGRLTHKDRARLIRALKRNLTRKAGVEPERAASFAAATAELAFSDGKADRQIAAKIAGGEIEGAGDELIRQLRVGGFGTGAALSPIPFIGALAGASLFQISLQQWRARARLRAAQAAAVYSLVSPAKYDQAAAAVAGLDALMELERTPV